MELAPKPEHPLHLAREPERIHPKPPAPGKILKHFGEPLGQKVQEPVRTAYDAGRIG